MRETRRKEREFRRRKGWYRFFRAITIWMLLMVALGGGFIAGLFAAVANVLPSGENLADIRPPAPTRVLAIDGTVLAKIYREDLNHREIVPLSQMKYMPLATIAIEDIRFRNHPGVDPRGIARAMVKNLVAGNSKEGASTLTQQLARNLYLSREKKVVRKLQEMVIALELERRYSKNEILETYLNQVYYGANRNGVQSWGVQMAAQNYFGKDVDQLTLAESALLAGIPKNPLGYDPFRSIEAAKNRRSTVLGNMLTYHLISAEQYTQAMNEPIKLAAEKKLVLMADYHAPYFVRHILVSELPAIFGRDTTDLVYRYGLDIYTSLDPRMQKVAEEAVTEQIKKNKFRHIDDGALISLDPKTGYIKAMVGGTNFRKDQYNIVTQGKRQPGSAFKPFVYTTALLHGYTPRTTVYDRPGHYPTGSGKFWSPKNSDGGFRGAMRLQQALWASRNAAAAGVAYDVGIDRIIDIAHRMGIKYRLEPHLTTSLGASVVVPMEICSAYGTLANGGVYNKPFGIMRVTSRSGEVLYEYQPSPRRAIPTETADTMQEVMRGVIERGTGRGARCPFPASGKTGTTNSYRDAWFIGYTDDLVTAVWVGNRNNKEMNRTFGSTVPVPIWREYMLVAQPVMAAEHANERSALDTMNNLPEPTDIDTTITSYIAKIQGKNAERNRDQSDSEAVAEEKLPPPSDRDRYVIMVCEDTHDRATPWCPKAVAVTYTRGRQPAPPAKTCSVHTGSETVRDADNGQPSRPQADNNERGIIISVCAETGKIATSKCTTVLRKRFSAEDAPTETCPLHRD